MPPRDTDELFMSQALELARQGIGLASPNPCVGAVVVDERGRIVGRGTHAYEGRKHAEVLALEEAGELARGNTLYLNLEPCSHQGRTAPCADAVIGAGVGRVVVSMRDPNPAVSGRGFEKLRAAGIEVVEGVLEAEARKLNESFARWIRTRLPFVTLKSAMTLDGKIAGPSNSVSHNPTALGSAQASTTYITGEAARAHVQLLRHASDAILVGVGTVIADDPLLTDRSTRPRRRKLMRVILDSRLRIPVGSRVVNTCENDVIIFCSFAEEKKRSELESRGVRVEQVPLDAFEPPQGAAPYPHPHPQEGKPDMKSIFAKLGEMEILSVLVEGGSMVNWACLASGMVDKIFFYYAPKIMGHGGVPFLSGGGFTALSEAAQVKNICVHQFGEDFAVEGYLRNPYE